MSARNRTRHLLGDRSQADGEYSYRASALTLGVRRAGQQDVTAAAWIAAGLLVGIFAGALIAQRLNAVLLARLFAILLVVIAWRLWVTAGASPPPGTRASSQFEQAS